MKIKDLVLVLTSILSVGCASVLQEDDRKLPSAIDANYPTAEVSVCGERFNGLGYCQLKKGQKWSDMNLKLQTYYEGSYRIYSDSTCSLKLDQTKEYKESEIINFRFEGVADKSCLIGFVVSPKFPEQGDQTFPFYSFEGYVWVSVIEPGDVEINKISKSPEKFSPTWSIPVDTNDSSVRVLFRGCANTQYDKVHYKNSGRIMLQAEEVLGRPVQFQDRCILVGKIKRSEGDIWLRWLIWGYSDKFTPLSEPGINIQGDKIIVHPGKFVAVVALDQPDKDRQIKAPEEAKPLEFDFDRNKPAIMRLLTSKGRSLIGEYQTTTSFIWKK